MPSKNKNETENQEPAKEEHKEESYEDRVMAAILGGAETGEGEEEQGNEKEPEK